MFPRTALVTAVFASVWHVFAHASPVNIQVHDQDGTPLANAVIEIVTEAELSPPTKTYIVDQVDKLFKPTVLVVPEGAAVNFPNSDNIRHHVYSFSKAKPFELKLYSGKPSAPITFDQAGIVVLGCNIHDSMVGYIYVSSSPHTYMSDSDGRVVLESIPQSVSKVFLWHPDAENGVDYRKNLAPSILQSGSSIVTSIPINDPAPRNTFEDVFGNAE